MLAEQKTNYFNSKITLEKKPFYLLFRTTDESSIRKKEKLFE